MLNTVNTTVGDGEQGDFVNADSVHNIAGNLVVGGSLNGVGTYTITGDTAQLNIAFVPGGNTDSNGAAIPNGALIVGEFGTGSFTQGTGSDSPTVTVAGDLVLGHQGTGWGYFSTNSVGTYTINSGTLTVGGNIGVGGAGTATDASGNPLNFFTQNGGTVNITGSANGNAHYVGVGTNDHTGGLFIGGAAGANNDGGSGVYIMNDGVLNAGAIEVGHSGIGIMTQSGGTVNASLIWLGNATGSNGTYNLSGGQINAGTEIIALGGAGTFNQTGGVNSISGLLDVGYQSIPGTYNLSGGSVARARPSSATDGPIPAAPCSSVLPAVPAAP